MSLFPDTQELEFRLMQSELTIDGLRAQLAALRAAIAERDSRIRELGEALENARVAHLPTCGGAGPRCFCGADEHNAPIVTALSRKGTP